jgi:hypothetical protein
MPFCEGFQGEPNVENLPPEAQVPHGDCRRRVRHQGACTALRSSPLPALNRAEATWRLTDAKGSKAAFRVLVSNGRLG